MSGKKALLWFLLHAAFLVPAAAYADNSCLSEGCHKKLLDNKFVHGPVAVGECSPCHMQMGKHRFRLAASGAALCEDCHEVEKKGAMCLDCHDPHGSDLEYQLKEGVRGRCAK